MPHSASGSSRFRFIVSPITTSAVDTDPMSHLAKATDAALRAKSKSMRLDGIVLFPIVTEPAIYPRADFITHKRASNAFYVGKKIDFTLWKRARRARRLQLALQNFQSSVQAIPDRHLPSEEKALILAAIEKAAKKVRQNAA